MTYEVEVTREGDAWIADVVNLPGAHTYARDLVTLFRNVGEVIRLVADLPDGAQVPTTTRYEGAAVRRAAELGAERLRLEELERRRLAEANTLAKQLIAEGMTVRDAATLLELSPGRISQVTSRSGRGTIVANVGRGETVMRHAGGGSSITKHSGAGTGERAGQDA